MMLKVAPGRAQVVKAQAGRPGFSLWVDSGRQSSERTFRHYLRICSLNAYRSRLAFSNQPSTDFDQLKKLRLSHDPDFMPFTPQLLGAAVLAAFVVARQC